MKSLTDILSKNKKEVLKFVEKYNMKLYSLYETFYYKQSLSSNYYKSLLICSELDVNNDLTRKLDIISVILDLSSNNMIDDRYKTIRLAIKCQLPNLVSYYIEVELYFDYKTLIDSRIYSGLIGDVNIKRNDNISYFNEMKNIIDTVYNISK